MTTTSSGKMLFAIGKGIRQTEAPVRATGASVSAGGPTATGGPSSDHTQQDTSVNPLLPPGLFMTDDHRYYFNGQGPFPSVTTVIDVLSKPALITWKAKEAARAVLSDPDRFYVPKDDPTFRSGMEQRILEALKEADKARDTAASIGSSVHLLAHMEGMPLQGAVIDSKGFQVSSDTLPYLEAFRDFLGRYSASNIISSEKAIWNLNGYAGTFDLLMMLPKHLENANEKDWLQGDTELWLIDIKTSKGYYPEYGLQLAAYAHGDYIILPNDPHPYTMPLIHRTGILHLRPDVYSDSHGGWRLIEYPTTERDYIAFLGALEVYQWREEKRFSKQKLIGT